MRGERYAYSNLALLFTGVVATLLTGSRAGFAVMLMVFGAYLLMRTPRWLINAGLASVAVLLIAFILLSSQQPVPGESQDAFSSLVARQSAAFKPFESENLVGRDEIWSGRIENLNAEPIRWLIGWGFGSSPDTGPGLSPHMMPLQIIVELGLWALVLVGVWTVWLLDLFWRAGGRDRIMFWTTIALLLSSATQETFYPVPSTGGFLGLFMIMAIVTVAPLVDRMASPVRAREVMGTQPQTTLVSVP
jgi:O-antigen ligase